MNELDFLRFAIFCANEMRASSPIASGNMRSSIVVVQVNNSVIDIVVPVDYASYVEGGKEVGGNSDKNKNWARNTIIRCAQCYAQGNVDDTCLRQGVAHSVLFG